MFLSLNRLQKQPQQWSCMICRPRGQNCPVLQGFRNKPSLWEPTAHSSSWRVGPGRPGFVSIFLVLDSPCPSNMLFAGGLTHFRVVLRSSIVRHSGYSECFRSFTQSLHAMQGTLHRLRHALQFIIPLASYLSTLYSRAYGYANYGPWQLFIWPTELLRKFGYNITFNLRQHFLII